MAHIQNGLQGKKKFVTAKEDIAKKISDYKATMGSLTATMGGELLKHNKDENRKNILVWLWGGEVWRRHDELSATRVANTGTWIIGSPEFQAWKSGDHSRSLICYGMGKKFPLYHADILLAGAGKSYITYPPSSISLSSKALSLLTGFFDLRTAGSARELLLFTFTLTTRIKLVKRQTTSFVALLNNWSINSIPSQKRSHQPTS